jgi:hypothetical protein
MVKGQVIGGGEQQQATGSGRRRGGMLPPTGAGPIEVTREVLEAEQAARERQQEPAETTPEVVPAPEQTAVVPPRSEAAPAAPVEVAASVASVAAPSGDVVDLPGDDAPAAEILARCEQIILAARIDAEAKLRAIETAWLSQAGPAVRLVHRTKAYRELTDGAGKPYRSFQRWAQERCGISRAHAYRMVSEEPVRLALAPIYTGPLTTRQVDVLAPILRQYGSADAVRKVWSAAESTGGTSAQQLLMKRDVLELVTGQEDYEPPRESTETTPEATLAQMHKAVTDPNRSVIKQAVAAAPATARLTMMAALKLASELQSALDELDKHAE